MSSLLTIKDLANGLESLGDTYNALDVFADDVWEVKSLQHGVVPGGWTRLDLSAFSVLVGQKVYYLRLFESEGVVRFSRESDVSNGNKAAAGAFIGALAGGAIGAASNKKADGLVGGLFLGLLIGAVLGGTVASEPPTHRVFTLKFDPETRTWRTYNGALVRWMKSELSAA